MAKKSMLADSTAQKIKSMIEGGNFSVGDKLPNENDFASQLGVSRSTLREAIRTLTASGMLEIKRGKGTFVTANTIIESSDIAEISSGLDDLFEMRLMFEPDCAYYAALRATDDEIETICKYGEAIEKKHRKRHSQFICKAIYAGYFQCNQKGRNRYAKESGSQ